MAVPTSYTEEEFKEYLHAELGPVAGALGWQVAGGQYDEPVNDALFGMDVSLISEIAADDISGFRVLGKLMTWRKVLYHVSSDYDFDDKDASFSRSQAHDMAMAVIEQLEDNAEDEGVGTGVSASSQVTVGTVVHTENPYAINEEEENA